MKTAIIIFIFAVAAVVFTDLLIEHVKKDKS